MHADRTLPLRAVSLPGLVVLRIVGRDAVTFLQGQFTSDLRELADGRTQLSACCSTQGRVIAIVRFRQLDEAVYVLLPADLVTRVANHLRRFILRSKVQVLEASDLHVGAISGPVAESGQHLAELTQAAVPLDAEAPTVTFRYGPGRAVVAAPQEAWRAIRGLSPAPPAERSQVEWLAADIAAGLPLVTAATAEQFIPQMLNLDLLDAVSFTKGCYTGQEIVARTQHLGRVKRRTMRFRLAAGAAPAPLQNLLLNGAKAADVLVTAATASGIELLAVTNLDVQGQPLTTEDGRIAEPIPLPYPVVPKQ
jgi:tRNA-modifying protein YgfZ